jgi:itaconyl-CoA hydratase
VSIRNIRHGHLYEDFLEGRSFDHHWGRTFTSADTASFSTMTMQFNPIYFNDEYAQEHGYRAAIVHPLLVFATALGLSVQDLSEAGGPFLGVEDVCYGEPVYPGDTITARSVVLDRRLSSSRPGWGIVHWRTTSLNQRGEQVVEFRRHNLSKRRTSLDQRLNHDAVEC